jgi:hypothetical protein
LVLGFLGKSCGFSKGVLYLEFLVLNFAAATICETLGDTLKSDQKKRYLLLK